MPNVSKRDRRRASGQQTTAAATDKPVNQADQGKFSIPARPMADSIASMVQGYSVVLLDGKWYVLVPEGDVPSLVQGEDTALFSELPSIVDKNEGAKALGMSPRHLQDLLVDGRIPAYKMGKLWRIPRTSLRAYVDGEIRATRARMFGEGE